MYINRGLCGKIRAEFARIVAIPKTIIPPVNQEGIFCFIIKSKKILYKILSIALKSIVDNDVSVF